MGFSLKKLLEGAAAQVNMNDGGKTFATVVRNQPVQSQPAKTPPPSYGSNPVKQAINRTRDVFDANTPQDRFKRQLAQKPVIDFTAQDRARQTLNGVKNVAGNYAKGFVESYNQVGTGLGTLLAQNSADVKNAQKAQNNLADQLHQQRMTAIKTAKNPNLNDVQRNRLNNYYNSLDRADVDLQNSRTQQSNDLYSKLDPKKNLAAIGSVGFDIATLGVGTGGTQAVKQAFKSGIKTGAKELGGQMVKTGSLGAVSGGLSPIVQKGDQATAKDILQGAGMGFAMGAALPAVAPAVKFGGSKAVNTVKGLTKENLGAISPRMKLNNQKGFARSTEESPVLKKLGIVKDGKAMSVDPLEALKAEARKYKSAEEFINSQKSVYHGTNADITEFGQLKGGRERGEFSATNSLFASENPELAGAYGKNLLEGKNTGKVLDTTTLGNKLDPNERVIPDEFADYKTNPILEPRDRRVLEESYFKSGTPSNITIDHLPNIQEYFRSKGYSAIQIPRASDVNGAATEMVIIDPTKIKTKQQLTDLYNQATQSQPPKSPQGAPIEKTPTQTPIGPVSKVEKSGTPVQSPELGTQKMQQTQPSLSQATGKVDDLATGKQVSGSGKLGATAQNQTNLEPDNTYTSTKQQRGFKSNIAKDTDTPLSVYKDIPGYNVKPNAKTIGSAAQRVAKDPEGTYNRLLENGIQKTDDSADALVLLRNLVENDELDKASKLAKATAKAGTDFGQAVQIFSAFRKTTPDGALRDSWNIVNAYNAKHPKKTPIRITPEQTKRITDLANDLQNTEYGTREWAKKAALLEREKGLLTPNSFLSKVSTVQTMAQLLNPKTAIRNILGNGVLDLAEDLSRLPATGIDKALKGLGLIDERNMVVPNMKTNWANKLIGFKQGVEDVNLGIRTTGAAGNYDLTKEVFKPGSVGNKLEKLLGYELSSMDKAFFTGRYQSSLENMMKAQKVKVPTPEMKASAEAEALYATFQNNSYLSRALQTAKNAANFGQEWGLGDFILKYPKTPGNIVNVGLDYSPVGFFKGLKSLNDGIKLKNIQNIRNGELLLGRSLVGSGLIAGGAFLAKQGIISGKQDGDFDKSAADRELGKGPFTFNITALGRLLKGEDPKARPGDITANYDWLQPNAIQLSMGANMVINNNSATQQINANLESLGAGIDTISEQPVFRGVKDFVGDLNPQQGGGVGKAMQNVATNAFSSFVPSLVNQVGQQFDNTKRSSYSNTPVGEAINRSKARIPGARNTLYPSLNTLGEEQKQYDVGGNNPFNVFFNPAFLNRVKDSPALSLADDLNQKTGETSQYPRSLTGNQIIDGVKTKLTPGQLFDLKKNVGQTTKNIFNQFASNPAFNAKSDTEKIKLLSGALTDINAAGKAQLAAKNSLGQFAPGFTGEPTELETGPKKILSDNYDINSKIAGKDLPKNLRPEAVNVIANYNAENAKQPSNDKAVKEALKAWNNGNDLPLVTNEVAKQWAEYERKAAEGSLSKIAAVDEKKKILRNAYSSQLNKDERDLYKLSATRLRQAYNDGLITDENINKALMVEKQMFDNGLLESETLAKNLGLVSRNKSAKSSGRKKSSGGSRRASSKKLKTTKTISLDTFKKYKTRRSSTNASLRKLLGSAKV